MPEKKFPGPYVNTTNADDPMMERVPMPTMGIGARPSGLPKSSEVKRDGMTIRHTDQNNK